MNRLFRTRFVSAVHIPTFAPQSLISGGGDPYLQCWEWISGLKHITIPIADVVQPFIKVRPPKGRPWSSGGDGEDGESIGDEKPGRKKGKGKRKKGKRQSEEPAEGEGEAVEGAGDELRGDSRTEDVVMDDPAPAPPEESVTQDGSPLLDQVMTEDELPVLVINRIETVVTPDGSKWIVFNAVGYVVQV